MGQATEKLKPRIHVACLAAYNNGWLHGVWIDVEDDADAVRDATNAMLKASPVAGAEEYAIHDHEGFGGVEIAEYAGVDKVVAIASFLREGGTLGPWCWSTSVGTWTRRAHWTRTIVASSKAWPTAIRK